MEHRQTIRPNIPNTQNCVQWFNESMCAGLLVIVAFSNYIIPSMAFMVKCIKYCCSKFCRFSIRHSGPGRGFENNDVNR